MLAVVPVRLQELQYRQGEEAMAKGDIHTFQRGDRWVNEVEGGKRASNSAPTKAEAQAKGREMAIDRGVEHLIHKQNGQIGERNTYPRSRDPRRPEDKAGGARHSMY